MSTLVQPPPVTVADLVEALRAQQNPPEAPVRIADAPASRPTESAAARAIVVIGAHPGAGTTTVSVAVADALADLATERGVDVIHLVDAAAHHASGMAAATGCAVGGRHDGWRAGRRGPCTILRPAVSPTAPRELPPIRPPDSGWLVVDAGWPWRVVVAEPNPILALVESAKILLVCRASVPGVRQVELALDALPGSPFVVAVGARRWPAAAAASFGPRLAQTVGEGRAAGFASDRRVEVNGVGADAFPGAIANAAMRLVRLLWPDAVGSSQHPRMRGLRR